jgi:cytidyltransferase-like protein
MRVVVISGYFNPVHTGHIDYIKGAAALGDKLVVIVNNDAQVSLKGSTPFMSEYERVEIVSSIKGVTQAVMSIDTDETVVKTIEPEETLQRNNTVKRVVLVRLIT